MAHEVAKSPRIAVFHSNHLCWYVQYDEDQIMEGKIEGEHCTTVLHSFAFENRQTDNCVSKRPKDKYR